MHLNTKKIAFAGVMLALTEVGIALGSVIETNTLFLLAAASFFVGIVIQEFGLKSGAGFLLAGIFNDQEIENGTENRICNGK